MTEANKPKMNPDFPRGSSAINTDISDVDMNAMTSQIDRKAFSKQKLSAYHPPRPGYERPEPGVDTLPKIYGLEHPKQTAPPSGMPAKGREGPLAGPPGYPVPPPDTRPVQGQEPSQYPIGAPTRANLGQRPKQVRPPKVSHG